MIHLTDNLWIGGSTDGRNLSPLGIGAILNVAHDLCCTIGWPHIEYMQVGLVDGPGNPQAAYYSAVLALHTLLLRKTTIVCCHGGSRSMAVCLMYMNATHPTGIWGGWMALLNERCDINLPLPHEAHRAAFDTMNWKLLSKLMGDS